KCKKSFQISSNLGFFLNVFIKDIYICSKCIISHNEPDLFYISISKQLLESDEQAQNQSILILESKMLEAKERITCSIDEMQCSACHGKKPGYECKCINCQEMDKRWCERCLDENNECVKENHLTIYINAQFRLLLEKTLKKRSYTENQGLLNNVEENFK